MVSDKNLLILSFFGFLIPFFYYVKIPGLDEKPRIKIVVGVLSNFNNFEQRKIIRYVVRAKSRHGNVIYGKIPQISCFFI